MCFKYQIEYQQGQNYIKEHANYKTGVCTESQFKFYNWIIRIVKLYNRINLNGQNT